MADTGWSLINRIVGLGNDALANQYEIFFPAGIPGTGNNATASGNSETISMRCDQPFDSPAESVGTYEIKRRGIKIVKTAREETTEKTFTIGIRLDENFDIYDTMMRWKNYSFDTKNGVALPDGSGIRVPVGINSFASDNSLAKTFIYNRCKPISVKLSTFSYAEDGAQKLDVIFIYGYKSTVPDIKN